MIKLERQLAAARAAYYAASERHHAAYDKIDLTRERDRERWGVESIYDIPGFTLSLAQVHAASDALAVAQLAVDRHAAEAHNSRILGKYCSPLPGDGPCDRVKWQG